MVRTRGGLIKSPSDPVGSNSTGRRLRSSRSKNSGSSSRNGDLYNRNESTHGNEAHWVSLGNNINEDVEHTESAALSQTGNSDPPSNEAFIQNPNPQSSTNTNNNSSSSNEDNNDLVIYANPQVHPLDLGEVETSTQLPEDLKINLECPVCGRISLPPIMQCRNGHVTCNACRPKVQSCPVCREIDIDIRNMFAEKAITYLTIQCEFDQYGCKEIIQFRDKEAHERTCKYRPYICPYIECDHKLSAEVVVDHVSSAHREECRRSDGPEITASMILIGRYFGGDGAWWLHHWVWLLGEEEEAMKYLYEITAFKGNTRYVYGGEVASLRTTDDDIVSGGQCLSISDAIGRRLRDEMNRIPSSPHILITMKIQIITHEVQYNLSRTTPWRIRRRELASQEEPLDLSLRNDEESDSLDSVIYSTEHRMNLEEKLQTLLNYYESLTKENSLLRAQENELLQEIQTVRDALLLLPGEERRTTTSPQLVHQTEVPDLRFAVSKGLEPRRYVKRRQSSISTTTSSSAFSSSSEEDFPPSSESKTDILVREKKAHWCQTIQEADRLGAINKELTNKANELELKIKWIKEALRKGSNDDNNNNTGPSFSSPNPSHIFVSSTCNTTH
ncbi:SIAH1 [Lepeophtheirus salmonis]|uniref:RING-type E3 ubiquitin transferase n=1 Tax=Lepeophtheirus salmonis TaxID=72036 RepID=A0A7R8CJF9_LEPSM|nr:SIAH1 [Lepeophtheirus salmonis]CAF2836312.1 SIAH1 [Lepeophtheirus salmonis]